LRREVQQTNERQTMAWRGDERSRIGWMMWRRKENKRASRKLQSKYGRTSSGMAGGLKTL
jgi:hypothetical protein